MAIEAIGGLAGLGDGDDEGVRRQDGLAVAELAGVLGLGGEPCHVLDHQTSDLRGVVAGAHAEEDDAVEGADAGGVEGEAGEGPRASR